MRLEELSSKAAPSAFACTQKPKAALKVNISAADSAEHFFKKKNDISIHRNYIKSVGRTVIKVETIKVAARRTTRIRTPHFLISVFAFFSLILANAVFTPYKNI